MRCADDGCQNARGADTDDKKARPPHEIQRPPHGGWRPFRPGCRCCSDRTYVFNQTSQESTGTATSSDQQQASSIQSAARKHAQLRPAMPS